MKYPLLLILLLGALRVAAADTLQVSLNKTSFAKGDTIEFTCLLPGYLEKKLPTATLNVWIEDIGRNKRWKYRYPMLNGEVSASLAVGDNIAEGAYAINFLVQRGFFRLSGEVTERDKNDTSINYMMIVKNKKGSYFDNAKVARDGSFRLKSTLFEDSAYFVFTPAKKIKDNYLQLHIETPLDSVFVPEARDMRFFFVGKQPDATDPASRKMLDTAKYAFDTEEPVDKTLLPGVTVTTTAKKAIDKFNEENSHGLFDRNDAIIFDGIESEEIARSVSLYQFLQTKVPGLVIERDTTGLEYARWRNEVMEVYVDEFKVDIGDHLFVVPTDIAMIKVYRPPANISLSSYAGAIAIYTKKDKHSAKKNYHNFIVKGYTAMDSKWQ
jgi:hypothetical protein